MGPLERAQAAGAESDCPTPYRGHTAAPGSVCQHRPAVSGSEGEGTCHENEGDTGVLATWGLGSGWRVCLISTVGTRGFALFSGGLEH